MRVGLRTFGWISFLFGVALIFLYSAFSITGAAVFWNVRNNTIPIIGLVFLVVGIVILLFTESEAYQSRESRLREIIGEHRYEGLPDSDKLAYNKSYRRHLEAEERRKHKIIGRSAYHRPGDNFNIIKTEHFERAIRGHDKEAIERAIRKIGTGLGKEEKLKHLPGYSVRVSKGGRIIYDRKNDRTIELQDYLPGHEYTKGKF